MKLQRLYSLTRQAIEDYQMIQPDDRIVVGLSGGKDSLTLLYALSGLRKFYPKPFSLEAITVDLGFQNVNFDATEELCKKLQVPYHIVQTQISEIVFDIRKETNPCSLCAKMRKGALNNKALELGANKIAYAHHKDDVIETMMMSLIYEGRFHCFSPYTYLNKTGLTLIRPLLYLTEADIIGFRNQYQLPVIKSSCPMDGNSKREYTKQLLQRLNKENPGLKNRLFSAILNSEMNGWKILNYKQQK